MDDEILKLKKKLSQCQLERERLRAQRENLMIKEKLVLQEREELEEKLRVAREATLSATSEFERKKKPLKEALDSKTMSGQQLSNALDELDANCEQPYMAARSAAASDKLNRLSNIPHEERDKLNKLHSEINEKRDKLLAFLKTCVKNSLIIDDVKPLLRVHVL